MRADPAFQVTTLILVIVTSALHIYLLTTREHLDFRRAIIHGLGSAIAFCLAVLVFWPVAALLSYHMRVRSQFNWPNLKC